MKKFFIGLVVALMTAVMFMGCKSTNDPSVQVSKVTLSNSVDTVKIGSTVQLSYTVEPTSAKVESAVWSSSAEAIATVDQNGVVKGIAEGTATITITVNGKYTATCAVTVTTNITGVKLSCNSITIKVDSVVELSYTVEPKGATVYKEEWRCTDPDVAMIYGKSVLGVGEGTSTVTLKINGQFTDSCKVTVEENK